VRTRPLDDRQAAGAGVAARRRARVAEQREADAAVGHVACELVRADELAALAVGEDEDGPALGGDELPGLGRRADREPRLRVRAAQVGRERVDPRLRQRARAVGVLGGIRDRRDRRGGGNGEHRGEGSCAQRQLAPGRKRDAGSEARGDGRIDAREVARSQVRHGAHERKPGDQPQRERCESAPAYPIQPAMGTEGESRGQGGEGGRRLDADPGEQVRLGGEQPQGSRRRRSPRDRSRVLAGAAGERGVAGGRCGARRRGRPTPANVHRVRPQ